METSSKLLRLLDRSPYLSQREIAKNLKVSLGTVNYCLKALVDSGALKVERFKESPSKTKYLYLLTPKGIQEKTLITARFLKLKRKEYERLNDEIQDLEAALSEDDQSWPKKYWNESCIMKSIVQSNAAFYLDFTPQFTRECGSLPGLQNRINFLMRREITAPTESPK